MRPVLKGVIHNFFEDKVEGNLKTIEIYRHIKNGGPFSIHLNKEQRTIKITGSIRCKEREYKDYFEDCYMQIDERVCFKEYNQMNYSITQ